MLESVADVDLPTELRKSYHSFTIKVDQEHQLPFWNVAVGRRHFGRAAKPSRPRTGVLILRAGTSR